jgi:integrase
VLTRKLQAFADSRGYVMLDQFTATDIDVFYSTSKLGIRSKAKMLESIRRLFGFFVNREFIAKSPVSADLKPPIGGNRMTNKMPFTDEQLADIIKACDQINGYKKDGRWGNRHGSGELTGEDLKDFIWLMTYTGLRISDVVLFDMERLQGNEVFLRAKKNGGEVFTYVPDWLRDRLQARAQRCGKPPFMTSRSQRLDGMTDIWRQGWRRFSSLLTSAPSGRLHTGSVIRSRASSWKKECLSLESQTLWAISSRSFGNTIPGGVVSVRPR